METTGRTARSVEGRTAGSPVAASESAIRILLIDDHRMFREGLRALLQHERDFELAAEADDGRSGVRLAHEVKPDVAIVDVAMPGLNGVEATRQLSSELPRLRTIGLSMHSERRFVTAMLRAGARGYVLKETAFEELATAVRSVREGHRYMSPGVADEVIRDYVDRFSDETPDAIALTAREREVLQLLAEGHVTREAAEALHVSTKTIESHRSRIMDKLGTHSIAELTKYAIREGITSLES